MLDVPVDPMSGVPLNTGQLDEARALAEFARQIVPQSGQQLQIRLATFVSDQEDGTATIILGGAPLPIAGIPYLQHATPIFGDTLVLVKVGGDFWILGAISSGWDSDWDFWLPTITSQGPAQPSLGNGSLWGYWRRTSVSTIYMLINWQIGSTTSGGQGGIIVGMPPGFVGSSVAGFGEQHLPTKIGCSAIGRSLLGFAYITAGASTFFTQFPVTTTNTTMGNFQNQDSAGNPNSGVPQVSPFPLVSGSNFFVEGLVRIHQT